MTNRLSCIIAHHNHKLIDKKKESRIIHDFLHTDKPRTQESAKEAKTKIMNKKKARNQFWFSIELAVNRTPFGLLLYQNVKFELSMKIKSRFFSLFLGFILFVIVNTNNNNINNDVNDEINAEPRYMCICVCDRIQCVCVRGKLNTYVKKTNDTK